MIVRKRVEGLHCPDCAARVEKALRGLEGVRSVTVDADSCVMEADIEDGSVFDEMCLVADYIEPGTIFV